MLRDRDFYAEKMKKFLTNCHFEISWMSLRVTFCSLVLNRFGRSYEAVNLLFNHKRRK